MVAVVAVVLAVAVAVAVEAIATAVPVAHASHVHHAGCIHDTIPQHHVPAPQHYAEPGWDHTPEGGRVRRRRLAQDQWGGLR